MEAKQQNSSQDKLPIYKCKAQIIKSIQTQSAIIISGLTGCGKSTQVPQYLLDAYPNANIAVCEPRRLAATSLALRVCQERKTKLGSQIGYQIGLQSKRSQKTRLVYMTYGILIQELLFKQQLNYDFIILDQVHERSLQMDFAFVILKKIINEKIKQQEKQSKSKSRQAQNQNNESEDKSQDKEPHKNKQSKEQQKSKHEQSMNKAKRNLKIIVMSATLNSDQFQKYFAVHKISSLIIQPEVVIRNKSEESKSKRRGTRQDQRRRGNVQFQKFGESKKEISINYANLQEYRQGKCIFIDEKSQYVVNQSYLQDFLPQFQEKAPSRNYLDEDEVRLQQKHYEWGIKLIEKSYRDIQYYSKHSAEYNAKAKQGGDILVFLPGLIQITRMKQALTRESQSFAQKIVQVHSSFSEQLYFKLFKSQVKNKIILATNIGESSITLPNCKVVIDYCLNRKAVKNNKQGISHFKTTVASLSNLTQRKGRVGRVSDGTVYRMITRQQFAKLKQFDVPQIKCVSLQMAILKTKKLQATAKSHIFEDVYEIFLNVLQPPEVSAIQTAIDYLIHEDAIEYVQDSQGKNRAKIDERQERRKINSGKKYDGKRLKITKVGEFMVSMPCDLGISKLILMGIKLGIPSIIVDIAAIILSTKSFFCHEQRRANIEQFMHSIIGYDEGDNNDYLLRERIFDHWRTVYYIPYREKHRGQNTQSQVVQKRNAMQTSFRIFDFGEEAQFDQNYKLVDKFVRKSQTTEEKDFCKNRGVYANHMRELLRLSETLKIRIQMIGVQKSKLNTFQPQSQLVLICLMYAFPDLICEVNFETKRRDIAHTFQGKHKFSNKVDIPLVQGLDINQLQRYLNPQRQFDSKKQQNSLMVTTYDHVLKKFLLPKWYTKAPSDECSLLYRHCKFSKVQYAHEYNVFHGFSNVTVLNESINKQILISRDVLFDNRVQNKYLISNNLIQSKGRYMVGANALISQFQLVIISMIVKKSIKICLHASKEFFSHIQLNEKKFQIPLMLTSNQLALINKLRALSKRKKEEQIASYRQQFGKQQLKILSNLFKFENRRPLQEEWQQVFIQEQNRIELQKLDKLPLEKYHEHKEQQWVPIEFAEGKMEKRAQGSYYQRYNNWKRYLYESAQTQYKLNSTTEAMLICGHCNSNKKLVEIDHVHSFVFKTGLLKLNKYSGNWSCPQAKSHQSQLPDGLKIYCSNNHHIGTTRDSQFAQLDHNNIYLYVPFNRIYPLTDINNIDQYHQIINSVKSQGQRMLREEHEKSDEYQCKICYSRENYRKVFKRDQIGQKQNKRGNRGNQIVKDPLWNLVINHFVSNSHIQNKEKLKRSIKWD